MSRLRGLTTPPSLRARAGLARLSSREEALLYDDEYDDAMDEFDPSGGLGDGGSVKGPAGCIAGI